MEDGRWIKTERRGETRVVCGIGREETRDRELRVWRKCGSFVKAGIPLNCVAGEGGSMYYGNEKQKPKKKIEKNKLIKIQKDCAVEN